jgi:hypothetical protein
MNDLAERGIKLVSDVISKCKDEDQRQCLLQVIIWHMDNYQKYNKDTLAQLSC